MRADETIIANVDVPLAVIHPIVSQNRSPERYDRIFSDMDSSGVTLIHLGTEGDNGTFSNLHMPDLNKILAPEPLDGIADRVANPGC